MRRHAFVAGLVALALVFGATDLSACGDKFLRIGRSARFRNYAAVHPVSILVYKPSNATPQGIKEFEAILKRAGHKPVVVEHGSRISQALSAAKFDVVIADYVDTMRIKEELQAVPSQPGILPILNEPTKAVAAQAEKEYRCLIKLHTMTKNDALAEIDRLMELRLNGNSVPAAAR